MNLIIDVGNTYAKIAVFENNEILKIETTRVSDLVETVQVLQIEYPNFDQAIISSVVVLEKSMLHQLSELVSLQVLKGDAKLPFDNKYGTPETLGVDRIALAAAAIRLFPKKNTLVIDAGTCVTYDFINENGEYFGGSISPGLKMRYVALNNQTSKLPLLNVGEPEFIIGNTTESSIHSGVVFGICAEIDGIIDQYSIKYEDLTVILTGGDALFLSKRLKNTIFAHFNFLLEGLNYLLDYNKR